MWPVGVGEDDAGIYSRDTARNGRSRGARRTRKTLRADGGGETRKPLSGLLGWLMVLMVLLRVRLQKPQITGRLRAPAAT